MTTSTRSILFSLLLTGCAGSFESARIAGMHDKLGALPSRTPEHQTRCDTLDSHATTWGALTKVLAAAAGTSGLASLPIDDPKLRNGLVLSAGISGILSLGTGFVWDQQAKTWARECSQ